MHFGQFNLMGYRERGTPTQRLFHEAREQTKLAEEAGFEIAWFAEHHFSNYCVCPSPLMMVAHCAAVTSRIKLAPAVVVMPLYSPARLIAEIGMADGLSDGRLILGIGSGYQPYEFERFGAELSSSKSQTEELMDMVELAFSKETFSYNGRHYQLPETHISAQPVNGMPEIWIAGDSEDIQKIAVKRGYTPMFAGRMHGVDYIVEQRNRLESSFKSAGRDTSELSFGVQRFLCVTESREETFQYLDNCRHQMRLASALRRREEVLNGAMMNETPMPDEISLEEMSKHLLVGDVETIAERLTDEISKARPSHIMFHLQVGGSSYQLALKSIELFASEIKPLVEKVLGPLEEFGISTIEK